MRRNNVKLTPMSRRLSIYHLFRICREVSYQEVTDQMPSLSSDTISKDIQLLIEAGVLKTEFIRGKEENVYININTDINPPRETKSPTRRKNLQRLNRLCFMMTEIGGDPFIWYKENFPELSENDMLSDIRELQKLGMKIINSDYIEALWDMRDFLNREKEPKEYLTKEYMELVIEILENQSLFKCCDVFWEGYRLDTYTPKEGYFKLD